MAGLAIAFSLPVGVYAMKKMFWDAADVELCDFIEKNGSSVPSNSHAKVSTQGKYPLAHVFHLDILQSHDKANGPMTITLPPENPDREKSSTHPDRYVPYKRVPFPLPNTKGTLLLTVSYSLDAIKLTYNISTFVFYLYRRRTSWQEMLDTSIGLFKENVTSKIYECTIFQVPIRSCKISATGELSWRTVQHQVDSFVCLDSVKKAKTQILLNWYPRVNSSRGKGGYLFGKTGVGKTLFVQHLASHCKAVLYEFRDDSRKRWPELAQRASSDPNTHIICLFDEIHRVSYGLGDNNVSTVTLLTMFTDLISRPNILVIALCNTEEELQVAFDSAYVPLIASHRLGSFRIEVLPIVTKDDAKAVIAALGAEANINLKIQLASIADRFPLDMKVTVGELRAWYTNNVVLFQEQVQGFFAGPWPANLQEHVRAERLKTHSR